MTKKRLLFLLSMTRGTATIQKALYRTATKGSLRTSLFLEFDQDQDIDIYRKYLFTKPVNRGNSNRVVELQTFLGGDSVYHWKTHDMAANVKEREKKYKEWINGH